MNLPQKLQENLKKDFQNFEELFRTYDSEPFRGIRINSLCCSSEKFESFNIASEKTPFCPQGFYIKAEEKLGKHPLHHAGAFYVQEPSATSAVEVLNPQKGDYVLDLCAAPGGKSTQIAAKLLGQGLIWSNEIVFKRANILLSNFERMGIHNGIISSCHPEVLAEELEGAFDKILVDAPCSGEGMMRHDSSIAPFWSEENVLVCAERQLKILNSASKMLRAGGTLVYSTCTFSRAENEDVAENFLLQNPDFEGEKIGVDWGEEGLSGDHTRRIFPKNGGEGHFVAKFVKKGNAERRDISGIKENNDKIIIDFLKENGIELPEGKLISKGEKWCLSPNVKEFKKINILRRGIFLGEVIKNRFEPHHALYSAVAVKCEKTLNLKLDDPRINAFLHGEEIEIEDKFKGFVRVAVEGIPLSFGKASGGRLKNRYPKGLRNLK